MKTATDRADPILSARDLGKAFVGLQALRGFTVDIYPHEIVGLIGPNGAGKTTCFNLLTGFLVPWVAGRFGWWLQPASASGAMWTNVRGAVLIMAVHVAMVIGFWWIF